MNDKLDAPSAPVAPRKFHREVRHGETIVDPYFWLREKDHPDVTRYLEVENAYAAALMRPIKNFENALYDEILARIKQTDLSVPVRRGRHYYYSRTIEGQQYPLRCRKQGSLDAQEEILLDMNALAAGLQLLSVGDMEVRDDENLLA